MGLGNHVFPLQHWSRQRIRIPSQPKSGQGLTLLKTWVFHPTKQVNGGESHNKSRQGNIQLKALLLALNFETITNGKT
jgi:hypothetical protein